MTRGPATPKLDAMPLPADSFSLTPDMLLRAYSIGLFPMAENAEDDRLFWMDPKQRGIFPLDALIISRSLAQLARSDRYEVCADGDFDAVITACADSTAGRPKTWINGEIRSLYRALFDAGFAHTIEVRESSGALVGGLYGVSLGAAFFGESMFHRARDTSKLALLHLGARLRLGGYQLLDTQYVTPHLATLGAVEIARADYHRQLAAAVTAGTTGGVWRREFRLAGREVLDVVGR